MISFPRVLVVCNLAMVSLCVLTFCPPLTGIQDAAARPEGTVRSEQPAESDSQTNWSRFRGPNGTGLSSNAKLPTSFGEDDYAWKTRLAGTGSSSPVVWGKQVFINSGKPSGALIVQCLDLETGKQKWQKTFESKAYRMHSRNSFGSSTPAVDKDHVYVAFGNPENVSLAALDHNGKLVWKKDLGKYVSAHGFASSPMIYKDSLIFINSQQAQRLRGGTEPGESHIMAFDCKTGKSKWSTPLTATTACYALPCIFSMDGKDDQLIGCNTGEGFYSINPKNGELNWKHKAFALRTVASTLLVDDLLIGSCGSGGGGNKIFAVRANDQGAKPVFEVTRNANYVPTPVAVDGKLFTFSDRGIVSCVDLKDGNIHWRERLSAGFSGSAVATNQHVYCIDESGVVFVIEASSKFRLVAKNELGEPSRSTPAIAGNRLLMRTREHLICVGK